MNQDNSDAKTKREQRENDPEPSAIRALYRIAQGVQDPKAAARTTLEAMGKPTP